MKRYIIVTIIVLLCCLNAFAQHRFYEISLDGQWQFRIDSAGTGESQGWFRADAGTIFPDRQNVPGNWNLRDKYAVYTGKAWYKKGIFIAKALKGKLIRLYFEGVFNEAKVWVNGKFVIANDLGYLDFETDISNLLNYGQQNTIVVCADNSFKVGALWNWGGIRRPVKLLVNDNMYITKDHITPKIDLVQNTADIRFELGLYNKNHQAEPITGKIDILQDSRLIKSVPFHINVAAGAEQKLRATTHLDPRQVKLWSLDEPNLYRCRITLLKNNRIIDQHIDNFGLRTIVLDNNTHQLKVNGKAIRSIGFDLVPDDRTTGNTLPMWRVKEDVDLMKSLGIRIARLSHVPFHKKMLDYLDEKGILIFEEIPVWGSSGLVKSEHGKTDRWLRQMIAEHYDHPCIAGWSVGNEIGDNKQVMDYVAGSIKLVKQQDSTRMGVMISHTAQRAVDPVDLSELGFVNAYGTVIGKKMTTDHQMHPKSTLFLSEFGMGQLHEDLSADIPIQSMMDSIRNRPYLIGASLWTFNDYRSTYKDTKEYSGNRPWGLVDVFRQKKQAFYSFQRVNKPVAGFRVSNAMLDSSKMLFHSTVTIQPRGVLDIPAYELKNYRVTLKLLARQDQLMGGDSRILPVIHPGDPAFLLLLDSKVAKGQLLKASISLESPLNYTVYDTTIYFEKPLPAKMMSAVVGRDESAGPAAPQHALQVRFAPNGSATAYYLRYTINGTAHETSPTIDHSITITGLQQGEVIHAVLISSNNAGETITSIPDLTMGDSLLPPLISYTEPGDHAFFAGFQTWKDERPLLIQVTGKKGDYTRARQITALVKGLFSADSLTNGQTYYYRVKRNAPGALWSDETEVKPDGGLLPEKPLVQGVILNGTNAVVCFKPVKKATGYRLSFRCNDEQAWHRQLIDASQIGQYLFKIPPNTSKVQVQLVPLAD